MSLNWKYKPPTYIYCHDYKEQRKNIGCGRGICFEGTNCKNACSRVDWRCFENYDLEECDTCNAKFKCIFGLI